MFNLISAKPLYEGNQKGILVIDALKVNFSVNTKTENTVYFTTYLKAISEII